MPRDRKKIFVNGLGDLFIRQIEPTEDSAYTNIGWINGTKITIAKETNEVWSEDGELLDNVVVKEDMMLESGLLQRGIDELNLIRNAENKVYSVRYCGRLQGKPYQYWCIEQARIIPKLEANYAVGVNPIPLTIRAIKKIISGYDVPLYYMNEANNKLGIDNCVLWIDAKTLNNIGTLQIMDISGYGKHGTASNNLWQVSSVPNYFDIKNTPSEYTINFGNVNNDDGNSDVIIEFWIKFTSTAVTNPIVVKKSALADNSAGYYLYRKTDDKIELKLSSGSASATVTTTNAVATNQWMHVLIGIDRNVNMQIYVNGQSASSAVGVSSIGSGSNTLNYYVGRDNGGSTVGVFNFGNLRHHIYPAGALTQSLIAEIASNHYNAERGYYGV